MSVSGDSEGRAWHDRHAIEDLIYRYADSVTRADWDQNEAVFAGDAILEIAAPYDIRVEGASAIRQFLAEAMSGSELLIQTAHSPVVQLLGPDTARATTTIHELSRGVVATTTNFAEAGTPVSYEQYGIYYDEAARIDGYWKFTRRFFQPLYQSHDALNGTVIATRSGLIATRPTSRSRRRNRRTMSNVNTVNAYFTAMRNKDVAAHRALFTEDAVLVSPLGTFVGVDAIAEFYRDSAFAVDDLWPEPGPFIASGDVVAVELRARANGEWREWADFFTLRDGKIERMVMYSR